MTAVAVDRSRTPLAPGLPFVGHLVRFFRDPLGLLEDAGRAGDLVPLRLGPYRALLVNHPDLVQQLLVTNHRQVEKRSPVQKAAKQLLGEGLATSEGAFHLRQRRLIQPTFGRARLVGYGREFVRRARLHAAGWESGSTVDLAPEMTRLTLAIIAKTLFDAELEGDGEADGIGREIADLTALFAHSLLPFPKLRARLPLPSSRRMRVARERLDRTVYRLIADHRADGRDRGDLLSTLLAARDEETGEAMADRQVRDEAMTLLAAGHETSANALMWTLYLLATHPEIARRVREEVRRVAADRAPEPGDLEALVLLRAVVSESLRLYPPAWLMTVVATEPFELGGVDVLPDTMLMASQWLLHRDARFFDGPLEFRPDRWTPEFAATLPKFAHFPFGGGPRVCIGEHFARLELTLVLATLVQEWSFHLAPGARVEPQPSLTLRAKYGLPVVVERVG